MREVRTPLASVASRPFAILIFCLLAFDLHAQSYPSKPIRMIVGFAPGGAQDVTARLIAPKLAEQLGQSMLVENRPGAGTSIAAAAVATSPADGHTVLLMNSATAAQVTLVPKQSYNLEKDLAPVSLVALGPGVLVINPAVQARSIKELIDLARAQPGKLNYGSAGIGSATHFTGEQFNLMAKVNIVHIPFKGGSESVVATSSGVIQINFPSVTAAVPLLKSNKLIALAVTSAKRSSRLPGVPTLSESGLPGYDRSVWQGILVPSVTPKDIVGRLNTVINKVMSTNDMKKSLYDQGLEPQTSTPEQFATVIRVELEQNTKLIALAGIKPE